jgi:23S rRNA (adenine2503-C2)-methyltransferase
VVQTSQDGTRKLRLLTHDGHAIESVLIPDGDKLTQCISSQVGCALDCSFCATGRQGFNRNLSVAEIIGQVWVAFRELGYQHGGDRIITNVVMMGMGEPLMNSDNVIAAMALMMEDHAYGLAWKRVTLSTAGIAPKLAQLHDLTPVSLAVSLHAPNDELRDQLVPINRKYPLEQLLAACRSYLKDTKRRHITFEYVMLAGVNDSPQQAHQLAKLLQGIAAKINLIPFNPYPGARYQPSDAATIERFNMILIRHGLVCTTRRTRGEDIAAACGQLVGDFQDRGQRRQQHQRELLRA